MSDRTIRILGISTLGAGAIFVGLCLFLMQATDSPQMAWVAIIGAASAALGNLIARKH